MPIDGQSMTLYRLKIIIRVHNVNQYESLLISCKVRAQWFSIPEQKYVHLGSTKLRVWGDRVIGFMNKVNCSLFTLSLTTTFNFCCFIASIAYNNWFFKRPSHFLNLIFALFQPFLILAEGTYVSNPIGIGPYLDVQQWFPLIREGDRRHLGFSDPTSGFVFSQSVML